MENKIYGIVIYSDFSKTILVKFLPCINLDVAKKEFMRQVDKLYQKKGIIDTMVNQYEYKKNVDYSIEKSDTYFYLKDYHTNDEYKIDINVVPVILE